MKIKKRFNQHHAMLFRHVVKKQQELQHESVQVTVTEKEISLVSADLVEFIVECDQATFFYQLGFSMAEQLMPNWTE
ncbi:MAG TPA: hypothetical protein VNX01_01630 [Bacteroidia bacterium]|jgi:hypothetical protein|nr:hypothetical protein [Bacteroidia bacterium]